MGENTISDKPLWSDTDVEKHWDKVAHIYVAENNKVKGAHDQRFRYSIPHLQLQKNFTVLNITSRDGEAAEYLQKAESSLEIINAEISQGLINVAASLRPWLKHVKLSTYSELPFADQSFDRILSLETLEHAAEPFIFLKELHRVSKSGAVMVLSCPPATSEPAYRMYTALFGGHGEGPHKFPSSRTVKQWLKAAGWNLTLHEGTVLLPVGPPFLKQFAEKIIRSTQGTFIAELGIRQFYVCNKP